MNCPVTVLSRQGFRQRHHRHRARPMKVRRMYLFFQVCTGKPASFPWCAVGMEVPLIERPWHTSWLDALTNLCCLHLNLTSHNLEAWLHHVRDMAGLTYVLTKMPPCHNNSRKRVTMFLQRRHLAGCLLLVRVLLEHAATLLPRRHSFPLLAHCEPHDSHLRAQPARQADPKPLHVPVSSDGGCHHIPGVRCV